MKNIWIVLLSLLMTLGAQAQDKKQLKKIKKKYGTHSQGAVFAKAKRVAILGSNVRFKLASRQAEETSWRKEKYYKFAVYSILEGINEQLLQDITDEYYSMLKKRFEDLGIEVLSYDELSSAKSYTKLKNKGMRETENVKKSWGIAQIYNYGNAPYITWNNASPFGAQQKLPKELDAVLLSSLVTIDFAEIGIDIKQSGKNYYGIKERVIYTEANSSVVPVIKIDGFTYNKQGIGMFEDNTYLFSINDKGKQLFMKLDMNDSEIESEMVFAPEVTRCDDCKPVFVKNFSNTMERGMGTVFIKADPEKYKAAVLDVLEQYLDEMFMVIKSQRK